MIGSLARLDPRTKLLLQVAFVAVAYAYTEPIPLAVLSVVAIVIIRCTGESTRTMLREFRLLVVVLALAPVIAALTLASPYFVPADGWPPAISAYRVLLVVFVSVAIARVTPAREAEAAIRWLIPGRAGRALGLGVGLVFRFMPLIRKEAVGTRRAMRARGAEVRPLHRRIQLFGVVTLVRSFRRADRVGRALRARCLAWNATVPPLAFGRYDLPVVAISIGVLLVAGVGVWP